MEDKRLKCAFRPSYCPPRSRMNRIPVNNQKFLTLLESYLNWNSDSGAVWMGAGWQSTMRKIISSDPWISRFRNALNTFAPIRLEFFRCREIGIGARQQKLENILRLDCMTPISLGIRSDFRASRGSKGFGYWLRSGRSVGSSIVHRE